jgi:drug/metabolite transporter (DMT)-like permease
MNRFLGIVLVAVSAAAFGTLAIFGRYAYAEGMDVFTVLFLRFSLSAVVMMILLAARREPLPHGLILFQLVGMGAIGYVGQAFSYLTALKYASSGLVALLLYLYPMFVAILSTIWLREPITRFKVVALGLALVGTALTVGPEEGGFLGVLLAISAAAIYSVYIIVGTQVMKQVSAIQSSTVIFASAGGVCGVIMLGKGPHLPATGAGWAVICSIVLIATVLPVVTFLAGLERIGPTNAAMLSTLEPVVTVLLAAMLLGETLRPITLLGGGLILTAVLLLTHSELRRTQPVLVVD